MYRKNLANPSAKLHFRLALYIFKLKMHIFRLNLYIFSLKMNFSGDIGDFCRRKGWVFRRNRQDFPPGRGMERCLNAIGKVFERLALGHKKTGQRVLSGFLVSVTQAAGGVWKKKKTAVPISSKPSSP